jgi:hypothetical protein
MYVITAPPGSADKRSQFKADAGCKQAVVHPVITPPFFFEQYVVQAKLNI